MPSSPGSPNQTCTSASPRRRARPLSLRKKLLFAGVLTALLLLLAEALLALVGFEPIGFEGDPYVGFASYSPLFVQQTGRDGNAWMVTAESKLSLFNEQRFPKKKPPRAYRIFCMGGSTTYGHLYEDSTSFCGWLREFLDEADDSRRYEVINAGGISYASYRVARLMEELVRYEPDLFIVYTGQNEFLERRTYASAIETPAPVRTLDSLLMRTRTYSAVRRLVKPSGRQPASGEGLLPGEVRAILDSSVGPQAYHRDDRLRERVLEHFRFNLDRMVHIARSAGAQVIFVTPASNLRDCSPFKSEHRAGFSDADLAAFEDLLARAERAGDPQQALTHLDHAAAIDDRYADVHYRRARLLWQLGRYPDAKAAFVRARDEDVCPLRALTPMPGIVAEIASAHRVSLVDFAGLIESRSEHGIPGDDWFLDHVHLSIDGYRMLGLALLDEMTKLGIVQPNASWGDEAIDRVTARVEARLDHRAQAVALRNLSKTLGWAGRKDEADRLALQALELSHEDAEALYQAGNAYYERGDLDRALEHYRRSLEMAPNSWQAHYGIGLVLADRGNIEPAMDHYGQALALNPDFADAHYNLARLYEVRSDLDQAAGHYREAIRIQPEDVFSRNNLGILLARQGDLDAAQQQLEAALRTDPKFADARVNLANVCESRGNAPEAIRQLREALRHDPEHLLAREKLARLQGKPGR